MDPRDLLRLVPDQTREFAIMLLDEAGNFTWWGASAEHIFGYRAEEVLGKPLSILFTPDEVERGGPALEQQIAHADRDAPDDIWLMRADGSRFWAAGVTVTLRDDAGQVLGFAKILRDRTDWKEQVEALRNRVQELRIANERKNIFLSTLSHELRNPLAPLVNALELIRMTGTDEALRYPIKLIERQVEFIRRLVDDLLDVTRITTGKLDLQLEPIDLRDVIQRALEMVQPLMQKHAQHVQLHLLPTPLMVNGDALRLQQIFANLLTNAAKYSPPDSTTLLSAIVEGNEVVVRVRDNGIGIPKEMHSRIFELFTQVEKYRSEGGLGIGLALVKELVTQHDGAVQVRSEGPGKGSEFTVRLPLCTGSPPAS